MFGAANMNNMLVNTSQKPIVNPNPAGAGAGGSESSGCLGLPPGGSSDGAAATKGSGKGKGRSKGDFPKFSKNPKKEKKVLLD